ncbi:MAG: phage portal protein [Spirochaetaceae bacterium]|nr:phage portal protein [Spirochaetaceae bacterium]
MAWRWPWAKRETRDSGGDFSDAIVALAEARAAGQAADASASAAVETAAGLLARSLSSATVEAADWARAAVTPDFLAQVGRDLVRRGESLHVIEAAGGDVMLLPAAQWTWEDGGDADPRSWTVRATTYGPSSAITRTLRASAVVFATWGRQPGTPHRGQGPTAWASLTGRLHAEVERSLGDEAAGPLAHLLAIPADPGAGPRTDEDGKPTADPLDPLRASIRTARGRAVMVETTAGAWDQGQAAAPRRDWTPQRLGPMPPDALATIRSQTAAAIAAAAGVPPALLDPAGTAQGQREAWRRFGAGTVQPVARQLAAELERKLETPVGLRFGELATGDVVARASAYARLRSAGMDDADARRLSGLDS